MGESPPREGPDTDQVPETLYHYCPTQSFHAIVQSKSLRLSSLSLSNDTMEGKLVNKVIADLAKKDSLDPVATQRLEESVRNLERIVDGLGFCLSQVGDLLSQWRGYADDGTGVSIGFSSEYLTWRGQELQSREEPNFALTRVEYDATEHESIIEPTYHELKRLIDEGAFRLPIAHMILGPRSREEAKQEDEKSQKAFFELSLRILPLITDLFRLKSNAFVEEREWRLLTLFAKRGTDSCSYRSLRDRIVPFREFCFEEMERKPINEVILGPKHITPEDMVRNFMLQNGYGEVNVRRSVASYR